jgi:hypothetical protein
VSRLLIEGTKHIYSFLVYLLIFTAVSKTLRKKRPQQGSILATKEYTMEAKGLVLESPWELYRALCNPGVAMFCCIDTDSLRYAEFVSSYNHAPAFMVSGTSYQHQVKFCFTLEATANFRYNLFKTCTI